MTPLCGGPGLLAGQGQIGFNVDLVGELQDQQLGDLPGRADGYPSGPPTDPYVRNARIRFLKQSRYCPWCSPMGVW